MSDVDVMDPGDEDDEDKNELDQEQEEDHSLGQAPAVPTPSNRINRVQARELAQQLWEEYGQGLNQNQLAELHGLTKRQVGYHLRKHAQFYGRREIDRARRTDLERIESLIDAAWQKAIKGDKDKIKLLLMMIKLRGDILGYAAPKKVEHSGEQRIGISPELAMLVEQIQDRNQNMKVDLTRVTVGELEPEIVEGEIVDRDD